MSTSWPCGSFDSTTYLSQWRDFKMLFTARRLNQCMTTFNVFAYFGTRISHSSVKLTTLCHIWTTTDSSTLECVCQEYANTLKVVIHLGVASYACGLFVTVLQSGRVCYISTTSASVSSGVQNTEKRMKARCRRPSAFIVSRFFNPLIKVEARVVDMASQTQ
jgi:hypothetical protein